jgi:phytoene synthase
MSPLTSETALAQSYAECERIARASERDLWLAALFTPERLRPHLHALAAFAHETGRIGERVREPLAGEMRLAWWRETLEGTRAEEAAGNPVAAALIDTMAKFALPVALVSERLLALTFDVYDDPMASLAELEAYGRATAGALIAMSAQVLAEGRDPGAQTASEAAGAGLALTRALLDFAASGRAERLPGDLLARHGVAAVPPRAGQDEAPLRAALAELAAAAEVRFDEAEAGLARLPSALAPAFGMLATARLDLRRWRRGGARGFVAASPWRRQWALWLWLRRR